MKKKYRKVKYRKYEVSIRWWPIWPLQTTWVHQLIVQWLMSLLLVLFIVISIELYKKKAVQHFRIFFFFFYFTHYSIFTWCFPVALTRKVCSASYLLWEMLRFFYLLMWVIYKLFYLQKKCFSLSLNKTWHLKYYFFSNVKLSNKRKNSKQN